MISSPRRLEANRLNALHSTGPRTAAGRAISSQNAVRHGLQALTPVVPGEREADWRRHRAGVLESLAPVGYLEGCLADRIALQLWRLGRVLRHERETLTLLYESAPEDIQHGREKAPDWSRSSPPTSLAEADDEVERWRETGRLIERIPGLAPDAKLPGTEIAAVGHFLANVAGRTGSLIINFTDGGSADLDDLGLDEELWPAEALTALVNVFGAETGRDEFIAEAVDAALDRQTLAEEARAALVAEIETLRRKRVLADGAELDKIARHEASIERSLMRLLHELQRLQAARQGGIAAPLALDVDFAAS